MKKIALCTETSCIIICSTKTFYIINLHGTEKIVVSAKIAEQVAEIKIGATYKLTNCKSYIDNLAFSVEAIKVSRSGSS